MIHQEQYPNWIVRIYHNIPGLRDVVIRDLAKLNYLLPCASDVSVFPTSLDPCQVQFAHVNASSDGCDGCLLDFGTFWRFLVAADPAIDRWVSRDIDSRLTEREFAAVRMWITNGEKKCHNMRDNPGHTFEVQAGMWGCLHSAFPNMHARILKFINEMAPTRKQHYGVRNFLKSDIWPEMSKSVLQHDSCTCTEFGASKAFPRGRANAEDRVGLVYLYAAGSNPNETISKLGFRPRVEDYRTLPKKDCSISTLKPPMHPCPVQCMPDCRPKCYPFKLSFTPPSLSLKAFNGSSSSSDR
jgi:hypothetical protein